ncbi:FtsB family cell division protein [Streptomyces albireticuli]|uniref:Acyl-phosphate glycerol 3-phosphate acyltransferase n=1 Tax=Streptomyces albireticuli TaxID=1940 RepID=A0A2A2D0J0_9ACTN|nr:septum formation initiator family protein [Streptomyces albireticuli]MCD9144535.1 septum formation initiator family protein [Streptomyces albireticuli]MCD9163402.1 septum formation initiator family protein [Streptomyces albireticuli]MCD9193212.1 septum formation initiator family protein [Streptomyces albireticuli]PAU44860.1 acyl-phosphate glycerol 3-phosphate acyltransferase [Streptomyces albireticuli]
MVADRFSTATKLKALGTVLVNGPSARTYRAKPPRRSRLTGRAALLALVVCSLVVALAYPMRQWVTQRSDIADQRRQSERAREQVQRLLDHKARLEDPAYVEQQAREHLHYVREGETGYSVVDGSGDAKRPEDQGAADRPWYSNLWDGVDTADADTP